MSCSGSTSPTPTPTPTPDPEPPKITCPAPQTVTLLTGTAIAVVYGSPTAINGKPPVSTACTPASGSLFPAGSSTVTCTATDTLQRTDSCSFAVTVVVPPQLSTTTFLAFGDSITKGEDGSAPLTASALSRFHPAVLLPPGQTYPVALERQLASRYLAQSPFVQNAGVSGEAVTDPDTLARFVSHTNSGAYGAVLIMEGSNDLFGQTDSSTIAPAVAGLRQMLLDAKIRRIRPYLATIPPINPQGWRGRTYADFLVAPLNDRIRELAAAEGVTLVDVHQMFGGNLALLSADGLHPNTDGYARIADLFFTTIKNTLERPASTPAGSHPRLRPSR